ncbi:MAG: valyl-tRNA synthetase [Candidatus Azotimanducaceae bacterium]|jgi:valyl-tRNA synthetase
MKKYQPQDIEQSWYQKWEANDYFSPRDTADNVNRKPFCIMIPPPNVTGTLHMGHGFQHSLVDSVIRHRRMKGDKTLWQMGTDHAGISTQLIVTEQLAAEGIKASELGREKFIERAWQWKEQSGGTISKQLRRLGASLDWSTERFTMDEGMCEAVLEVFVSLYDEGLIYRGKRLVNWDPALKTSISDLEVESEEEKGNLWHFKYPLVDSDSTNGEFLIVATTRPETMLGDSAVAVHPDDERYKHLVGKEIALPLTDRKIPIIADRYVDQEFGTGCVKITPGHDFNDYDMGKRHNLPIINIFNDDASLNSAVPEAYQGLERYEARTQVIKDLTLLGLLDKVEDHMMAVPRGEKSGVVIEPYLSDQWYVKIQPLADPAIEAVENGSIEFTPKNAENTYFAWMRDIQDWCISRQQWWGHQIPAWYDESGKVYVGHDEQAVREKYDLAENLVLSRDEDVLDTWFSSALWTFATLGWPEQTEALKTYHSTDLMVTGHDIISFWVSRMIMMTLKYTDEVPFKKVYIHGLVTDADGQKMSKSKGNGLDPMDIIDGITLEALVEKRTGHLLQPKKAAQIENATRKEFPDGIKAYGSDPLRFTFYSIASSARGIRFDMNRVEGYRNFCNKLWNAANFVFMNTTTGEDIEPFDSGQKRELSVVDRWIVSEFQQTIRAVDLAMETYRFDLAAKAIYEFVWDQLCDWYLELSKPVLNSDDATPEQKAGTRYTLISTLEATLRLAHPFIPFITEELWQQIPSSIRGSGETIVLSAYPEAADGLVDQEAEDDIAWLKAIVTGTRNIRGEMDISFGKPIPVLFFNGSAQDKARLESNTSLLEFLVKPESLTWLDADAEPPASATHLVGDMQVLIPLSDLIDKDAELTRLNKEIEKKTKEKSRAEGKINNPSFVNKAPEAVVQKEKDKVTELNSAIEQLEQQKLKVTQL